MKGYRVRLPLDEKTAKRLRAGDTVLLSGSLYTARDAAHKRLYECIQRGEELPICLEKETIYYVGPAPAKEGYVVGSAGPTSSYRMDPYTPALLERGLRAMLGKGIRSREVKESMKKNGAVYFACTGGAAVLISKSIKKSELVCYEDLGPEAIYRFWVEDFPAIVAVDSLGNDQYEIGRKEYLEKNDKGEIR